MPQPAVPTWLLRALQQSWDNKVGDLEFRQALGARALFALPSDTRWIPEKQVLVTLDLLLCQGAQRPHREVEEAHFGRNCVACARRCEAFVKTDGLFGSADAPLVCEVQG